MAANGGDAVWGGGHDHQLCVDTALDRAGALCRRAGARLTPLRRRVLELIWSSHRPVGAYQILKTLSAERTGAAPPTVYRTLDFLIGHGLVHRLASLNSYIGCDHPAEDHGGQFLICEDCGDAAELDDGRIDRAIRKSAAGLGFEMRRRIVEIIGTCPRCRAAGG